MKRATYLYAAAGSLFFGSSLYILFRSESLLMFRWANALGLLRLIDSIRSHSPEVQPLVPAWVIYSSPFAFWIVSYMLLVRAIWFGEKSIARNLWFWAVPVISIAAELGQYPRLVPGTFDIFDLLTITASVVFAFAIITFDATQLRKESS
jgi:hypothetical protein